MKITLDTRKTIDQNASDYFEKAKKLKKKIAGAEKTIKEQEDKLRQLEKKQDAEKEKAEFLKTKKEIKKEKAWYEKFHWFFTSNGFLVIAGKDATSNEIVVKKHAEKIDLIFHTEMAGSPFAILKTSGKKPEEIDINEAAQECAVYSRAWKIGMPASVFHVNPDQVTKEAMSGEFVPKGAFMIYGKKNFVKEYSMELAIGILNGKVIGGPVTAIDRQTKDYVIVEIGDVKKSDLAKKIHKRIGGDLDDIMGFLPGEGKIVERLKTMYK